MYASFSHVTLQANWPWVRTVSAPIPFVLYLFNLCNGTAFCLSFLWKPFYHSSGVNTYFRRFTVIHCFLLATVKDYFSLSTVRCSSFSEDLKSGVKTFVFRPGLPDNLREVEEWGLSAENEEVRFADKRFFGWFKPHTGRYVFKVLGRACSSGQIMLQIAGVRSKGEKVPQWSAHQVFCKTTMIWFEYEGC